MRTDQAAPEHKPGGTVLAGQRFSVVELFASDLPAYCPNARMPLWSSHPRTFLDVVNEREAMCPYCGTRYRLSPSVNLNEIDTRGLHQHHRQHFLESNAEQAQSVCPPAGLQADGNVWADAFGNTTLESMARWLRSRDWR